MIGVGQESAWANPRRLYLWIAPWLYLAYALVTPPFQTPDEHQHLFRAWQLASFQLLGERRGAEAGGEVPTGLVAAATAELGSAVPHADRHLVRTTWSQRFGRATPIMQDQPRVFANFLGSASYSPAGYGPQVLAIWFGRALGLSVEAIVRFGRVLNAGLTFALLSFAMRIIPYGRRILFVIGLLPMTAACAGSFGQDGLVIGGSALLVATSFNAMSRDAWSKCERLTVLIATPLITLAKFVYLPLAGLAVLGRTKDGRLRFAWPVLQAGMLAVAFLLVWLRLNASLAVPMMPGMPNPAEQAHHILAHPEAFPVALAATFRPLGVVFLWGTLFKFGWLNVGPVILAANLSLVSLIVSIWSGDDGAVDWTWAWRGWLMLLPLVVVVLLCLALYLAASRLGSPVVSGLVASVNVV